MLHIVRLNSKFVVFLSSLYIHIFITEIHHKYMYFFPPSETLNFFYGSEAEKSRGTFVQECGHIGLDINRDGGLVSSPVFGSS